MKQDPRYPLGEKLTAVSISSGYLLLVFGDRRVVVPMRYGEGPYCNETDIENLPDKKMVQVAKQQAKIRELMG